MGTAMTDELRALALDADPEAASEFMRTFLTERVAEADRPLMADRLAQAVRACVGTNGSNPFAGGIVSAANLPTGEIPNPRHYGLYPRAVTILAGETGAGKSALCMNIGIGLACGGSLFGFNAVKSRVLYVDPENSGCYRDGTVTGGLCGARLARIGKARPENLVFHDGQGVDLSNVAHMRALADLIEREHFDVVILDPIANLFNTEDENDNAEAARQMKDVIALSRTTGAAIIALHHMGRDTSHNYGRGATARLAAADVGLMFRTRNPAGDDADDTYTGTTRQRDDVCRLQIVKDRFGFFGRCSKYLRMAGQDRFAVADHEAWLGAAHDDRGELREARLDSACVEIASLLLDGKEHSRTDILKALREENLSRDVGDDALEVMRKDGRIAHRKNGNADIYHDPQSVTPRLPDSDKA